MKKSVLLFSLITSIGLGFSSCNNSDDESRYLSYTTVNDATAKTLILDADSSILVAEQGSEILGTSNWTDRKRLILDYTVLRSDESRKTRYVKINNYYSVLTKNPIKLSTLNTQELRDSIGYDPVNLQGAWFASGYLNINFVLYRQSPTLKHMINLVVDDSKTTADEIFVELKHNAFRDFQSYPAQGNASFDLKDYLTTPKASVKVYLSRNTYGPSGTYKTDTLTYTGGASIATKSVIQNLPSSLQ